MNKIQTAIEKIQKAEKLALQYSEDGFYLAFSGGKDSIVLKRLFDMAGVKYKTYMNLTTIDPPQLLKFIKKNYDDINFIKPPINFYDLIIKKKMLPLRTARYCCQVLKESSGAGTVTALGIRKAESLARSKRNELEIGGHKYSNSLDQFNIDLENKIVCVKGKDKIMLSPMIDWSNYDVWNFIRKNNMSFCELYSKYHYDRIGCIFCPMSSVKHKMQDRKLFPRVENKIKQSIQVLGDSNGYGGNFNFDVDMIFDWWVSNENSNTFINRKSWRRLL